MPKLKHGNKALKHPAFRSWWPWRSKSGYNNREGTIAPLIDLFVATTLLNHELSLEEVDTMLDFLRASYPEQDHGWLARHLKRAIDTPRSVEQAAKTIAPSSSPQDRRHLLFELYILLQNNGTPDPEKKLAPISEVFEQSDFCRSLPTFLSGDKTTSKWQELNDACLERLIIGGPSSEIDLNSDETLEVLVIRSREQIWLLNQGKQPLRARGRLLRPMHWLRLNLGHDIRGENHHFTHQELSYFFDFKKRGLGLPTFLTVDDGMLIADRNRSRDSVAGLKFGLDAELEALTDRRCLVGGKPIAKGEIIKLADHELIEITECGTFPIRELRRRSLELGGHFELAPQRQTLRASNRRQDVELRLSPNQAPSFEIEIRYSHQLSEGQVIRIDGKAKPTLNGKPLRPDMPLHDGDLIRLSPVQSIRCRFSANTLEEELTHISDLRVQGVSHSFKDKSQALSNLDFDLKRGEMLAIIGPSGCGKSTLLSILAGHQTPTRGQIRYNGMSLYRWRKRLLPLIAHLPHEQALNSDLTVREHLEFALKSREPRLSKPAIQRRVHLTLSALDLHHRANYRVGDPEEKILSAGERSRLNLGQDLVGSANVFLLDEPIAGLSSKDSEHIIESLHQLSQEKLIIATLHRPNSALLKHFSRLLVLDYGGHLAYCGPTSQAPGYFREAAKDLGLGKIKSGRGTDLIFEVLESAHLYEGAAKRRTSTLWPDRFESHRLMGQINRGNAAPSRSQMSSRGRAEDNLPIPELTRHAPSSWARLALTQFQRDILPRCRSKTSLLILVVQPLTLGFLISGILKYSNSEVYQFHAAPHIPAFLFLAAVVAMFFGLTTAATDLLRDGPTLRRERNARPSRTAYLAAKAVNYLLISVIQCFIFLAVSLHILEFPRTSWEHLPMLTLTSLVGCGLAMISSLLVKSERSSLAAVPLLLVPQVLLAGALVPFGQMNSNFPAGISKAANQDTTKISSNIPWLATINPLRYSFESMVLTEATRNRFAKAENELKWFRDRRLRQKDDSKAAKNALMAVMFLNTDDRATGRKILNKLLRSAKTDDLRYLEEATKLSSNGNFTLEQTFTNQVCNDAHLEAETRRLSTERIDDGVIFLGKRRKFAAAEISTIGANYLFLSVGTLTCWLIAALILHHRFEKNS